MVYENIIDQFEEKNDAGFNKKCLDISQDIISGRLSFLELIEQLSGFLVNSSPTKRELGVLVISEVLKNLPVNYLNAQQLQVIGKFYADKIKDHHQVLPAVLGGILTLLEFNQLPGEIATTILNSLFQNVACQQQQQADRSNIYSIYKTLLNKFPQELLSMKLDLVYGVISSIDGERDPRNLLFLFKWLEIFLKTVQLGHLAEDMFEVLACYFPVDFRAPPNDLSISREVLAESLCPCLCALPAFGEYCIPLALEKLDSSLDIAKTDSLKLLKEGCKIFDVSSYIEHISEIWSQIQKEVFTGKDPEIKAECLQTLSDVINKISQTEDGSPRTVLENILDTIKGNLMPDSKLFEVSISILHYIALGSRYSSSFVTKEVVPILINTYNITSTPFHKANILKCLVVFAKAYIKHHGTLNSVENELINLPYLAVKAILENDANLQTTGFDTLIELARYLPLEIRTVLYKNLCILLIKPVEPAFRHSILKCFKSLSSCYEDEVKKQILPEVNISDSSSLELYLNALCVLINLDGFRDLVINKLLILFEGNRDENLIAVKNIRHLLEMEANNAELIKILLQRNVVHILLNFNLTHLLVDRCAREPLIDISSILKILIGSQDSHTQRSIIQHELQTVCSFAEHTTNYVIILNGLLLRLTRDVDIDYNILDSLLQVAITNKDDLVRDVSVQLLANLINKKTCDETFNDYLNVTKEKCLQSMSLYKYNSIITLSWITKALLMRNNPQANIWSDTLLDLLEQHDEVAEGLKIIMNDNYESLSLVSHCNILLLYRQKIFVYVTNRLSTNYDPTKASYLRTVGHLMEYAPEQAILGQFKKISKLIMLCLDKCEEHQVLCPLLQKIKSILITNCSLIEENLEDFLERILKLTSFEPSLKVRIEALQCLVCFTTSFPLYKLLPFKTKVLHQLGLCVDDKKRLVRKEATETRSLWFLLDAPV